MNLLGSTYVNECVLVNKGVYGIADKFSTLDRGDSIHVSIQTALTGYGFTQPKIKKDGELHPINIGSVDAIIKGRYPIYSNLDDIFSVVTINGDFNKATQSWSSNTRVEFFTPKGIVSGFDLSSPTKGTLSFVKEFSLELTPCSSFSIGCQTVNFGYQMSLGKAVLEMIKPFIGSKSDFYTGRIRGSL